MSNFCNEYCFKTLKDQEINNLEVSLEELKKSNVNYIFSSVKIKNNMGLNFQKVFNKKSYPYIIYLYKLI